MIKKSFRAYITYGENEFYDLTADPGEEVNLAETEDPRVQEKIAFLKNQMEQWFIRYSDPDRDGTRQDVYGLG